MKLLRLLALLLFSPCMSLAQNQPEATVVTDALIQRAETGEAEAQWQLGECYRLGNGVAQNWETAVYWYEKSAAQQYVPAVHSLSVCLGCGLGINRDVNRAMELARFGAEKGFVKSKIALATYYSQSDMECDRQKAYEIFSELAERGDVLSIYNLGVCYKDGIGVQKDMAQAIHWMTKAAEAGNTSAQAWLALEYKSGTNVPQDMQKTLFWLTKAADNGKIEAMVLLARLGWFELKDFDLCAKYATMAAGQGDVYGKFFLCCCYIFGRGLEKNLEEAEKLAESIAQTRNPKLITDIATAYHQGKNYVSALKWAKIAIEYGDSTGIPYIIVGEAYLFGLADCDCDYFLAAIAFQKGRECGNPQCLYLLAQMYARGLGVEKNMAKAYQLMTEAADKGDTAASEWLIKYDYATE